MFFVSNLFANSIIGNFVLVFLSFDCIYFGVRHFNKVKGYIYIKIIVIENIC